MKSFLIAICALLVVGCEANSNRSGPIDSYEGGALLVQATNVAAREIAERKTATIQAATISAAQTRDTQSQSGTATAQAIQQRQTEVALYATANAASAQQQATAQAATETSIVQRANATQTADRIALNVVETIQARNAERQQTQNAARAEATGTSIAATSTRSALDIAVALERKQATATVEALDIEREQAVKDAQRKADWNDFFDSVLKIVLSIGGIALVLMGIIFLAKWLDSMAMRWRMVETRAGTVMIVHVNGRPHAQLVLPSSQIVDGDAFDESELAVVEPEAPDLLKLTTPKLGETFIAKNDPVEEDREVRRKLAMRLLREGIAFYSDQGMDPRMTNRIPSFRELKWASETWVRAVNSLKPYVVTKQGRGGGTTCAEQYPTLPQLYGALGERRIAVAEVGGGSPTASASLGVPKAA